MTSLALTLRERREHLGLTQRDVAKAIDTKQSHVCELENGQVDPRVGTVARWAAALGYELTLTPTDHTSALASGQGLSADRPTTPSPP